MSDEPTTLELLEQLAEYAATPSEERPHAVLLDAHLVYWHGGCGPCGDDWAPIWAPGFIISKAGEFALLAWRTQPPA